MDIQGLENVSLLRHCKDVEKMKFVERYITQLPDSINKDGKMKSMISFIKAGDALMISESFADLNWLQQHVLLAVFRLLDKDSDIIEKEMEFVLPRLVKKWEGICASSNKVE